MLGRVWKVGLAKFKDSEDQTKGVVHSEKHIRSLKYI